MVDFFLYDLSKGVFLVVRIMNKAELTLSHPISISLCINSSKSECIAAQITLAGG
ncbi:hypothetical protein BABINDRAFT_163859 [Babjeviella inositovora NRRL Y-12698]|uniref:Uncharacterized protein n=1 Tax=Babjeviella inositovora NRRL Y-12698 TaxID=984486 RepID=A0A1E3QHE6_9ASCO|nr:uncharacterized protein BABINDRAFT_163859 [Babjeviella inositovora NRRL Y-12698]ODQ77133.1 hypothetical protein BABINDRAFT_163859 [Babjeviella inositovora NRRL Y-12698]